MLPPTTSPPLPAVLLPPVLPPPALPPPALPLLPQPRRPRPEPDDPEEPEPAPAQKSIIELPMEMQQAILGWLPPHDRAVARLVCKAWAKAPGTMSITRAATGRKKFLEWALKNGLKLDQKLAAAALATSSAEASRAVRRLEHLRWLGCAWDRRVGTAAAMSGNIEAFEYMRDDLANVCGRWTIAAAVLAKKTEAVRWLVANTSAIMCTGSAWPMVAAAMTGQIEMLEWLRVNYVGPWDLAEAWWRAARAGHLEVLEWAKQKGYEISEEAAVQAAARGEEGVLVWLRSNAPVDARACAKAAEKGRLGTLQLMRALEPPYPWSTAAPAAAVENGHQEVAMWLAQAGCPWAVETGEAARAKWPDSF